MPICLFNLHRSPWIGQILNDDVDGDDDANDDGAEQ